MTIVLPPDLQLELYEIKQIIFPFLSIFITYLIILN